MTNINALLKATGNDAATIVGKDGIITDASGFVNTGSYTLNALLGGSIFAGLVENKITALAGESGVGKTYFALDIARNFLVENPEGVVVCFDTEAAITSQMIEERVGNSDRFALFPITTIQQLGTQISKLLTQYENQKKSNPDAKLLIILDSMGNLSTSKEVADMEEGNETKDMTRAQLIKGTFRALTVRLAKDHVPLLFTNHTYQGMGMFSTKQMSGGSGPLYCASQIIFLTKAKISEGKEKIGNIINMTMYKGRMTREGSKASTRLFFESGLDKFYGLVDICKEFNIWDMESKQFLIDGKKVWPKTVENNPQEYFTDDVLLKVDEACKKKFLYGSDYVEPVQEEDEED